ncbi:hypothetical protein ABEQ76_13760, partial [Bacillus velezensis]
GSGDVAENRSLMNNTSLCKILLLLYNILTFPSYIQTKKLQKGVMKHDIVYWQVHVALFILFAGILFV